MNARVSMLHQVGNEPVEVAGRPVVVHPSRFVTIELFEIVTGITEGATRTKIHRGVWLEGRQFVRRDGRVLMDMEGYERWAETGTA